MEVERENENLNVPRRARPSEVDERGRPGKARGGAGGGAGPSSGKRARAEEHGSDSEEDEEFEHAWIRSVNLNNFMCHDNKTVQLGRKLNFISGVNGAGKSAVIVAISVALGARGKDCKRADTLKDYIGVHSDKAIIRVTIQTPSHDPPALGDLVLDGAITIERHLFRKGRSEIKIFNKDMAMVSPTKQRTRPSDDLQHLLEHLNLQVSNPISIMHQNDSKTFLHSGKPERYFDLFLRSTLLSDVWDNLEDFDECVTTLEKDIKSQVDQHNSWKKNVLQPAEKEYHDTQVIRETADHVEALKREKVWVMVRQQEEAVKDLQDSLAKTRQRAGEYEEREGRAAEALIDLKKKKDDVDNEVKDFQIKSGEATSRCKGVKQVLDEAKSAMRTADVARKRCMQEIDTEEKEVQKLGVQRERHLQEQEQKRAAGQGRQVSNLRELEGRIDDVRGELGAARDEQGRLEQAMEGMRHEVDEASRESGRARSMRDDAQKLHKQVQKSSKNKIALFGSDVEEIEAYLHRNNASFGGAPPIGPLGKYLTIRDPKWRMAVADAIHLSACQTYLVKGKDEGKVFEQLVKKMPASLHRNQVRFANANYDNFDDEVRVYGGELTVWDVVAVTHPDPESARVIRNYLVDALRINEKRLCESFAQAQINTDVSRQETQVRLPNGVLHTLARDSYFPDEDGKVRRKMWCKKTMRGSDVIRAKDVFTADVATLERDALVRVQELQGKLDVALREERRLRDELKDVEQRAKDAKSEARRLDDRISELEGEKERELAAQGGGGDMDDTDVQLTLLEEEGRKREERLSKLREKLAPLEEVFVEAQRKEKAAGERMKEGQAEITEAQGRFKELMEKIKNINNDLDKESALVQNVRRKASEKHAAVGVLEEDLAKAEGELKERTDHAVPPRVESERSRQAVEKELHEKETLLHKRQRDSGKNADQVAARFRQLTDKGDAMEEKLQSLKEMLQILIASFRSRNKAFKRRRTDTAKYVNELFAQYTSIKDYVGSLVFDDVKGLMTPVVDTDPTHQEGEAGPSAKKKGGNSNNAKELSGGERSFTTLCLVLSLASASTSPLVALDEVDVYMDDNNRNLSLAMLVDQMRGLDCQTIIISPQSMATVQPRADVHKITMQKIDGSQRSISRMTGN